MPDASTVARGDMYAWIFAAIGGVVLATGAVSLFRLEAPEPPAVDQDSRVLRTLTVFSGTVSADDINNPRHLVVPNKYSSTPSGPGRDAVQNPGDALLRDYTAKLTTGQSVAPAFPAQLVPEIPADAIGVAPPIAPYLGFARQQAEVTNLPSREAVIVISSLGDGRPIRNLPVVDSAILGSGDWKPLEFTVTADPAGLVGPPILTLSSGVGPVDEHFKDYLAKRVPVWAVLDPGTYRIRVEP